MFLIVDSNSILNKNSMDLFLHITVGWYCRNGGTICYKTIEYDVLDSHEYNCRLGFLSVESAASVEKQHGWCEDNSQ